jgi:hypothetical protein
VTDLLVEEFVDELEQPFTWNFRTRAQLAAIMPYIYVHNNPAGAFTLSVLDSLDNLIAAESFDAADVYAAIEVDPGVRPYAHVHLPLLLASPKSLPPGEYKLKLESTGYTFSESSYLAWVKEHENLCVPLGYSPTSHAQNPMTYKLWVYE